MPVIRTWCGKTPSIVKARLVRDTETGLICEDERGVRYFAMNRDVISRDDTHSDLFGPVT